MAGRSVPKADSATQANSANTATVAGTVVHTFNAAGTATFKCDNPAGNPLFVTNAKLTAIPFANLENTAAP